MKLKKLYDLIIDRENVDYQSLKPNMRIAVVISPDKLDVMKIERIGEGRRYLHETKRYMALAKICPGQASLILHADGSVSLNEILEVDNGEGPYGHCKTKDSLTLGILERCYKAHWVELNEDSLVKRITKSEMREIQGELP